MKKNYSVPFCNGFLFVDFDVNNPACKDDPFVRIGYVKQVPKTKKEIIEFVAKHPVLGTRDKLFSLYTSEDIVDFLRNPEEDDLKNCIILLWSRNALNDVLITSATYRYSLEDVDVNRKGDYADFCVVAEYLAGMCITLVSNMCDQAEVYKHVYKALDERMIPSYC
jgi:hypothetical protein